MVNVESMWFIDESRYAYISQTDEGVSNNFSQNYMNSTQPQIKWKLANDQCYIDITAVKNSQIIVFAMKYKPLTLASAVKMHTQRNYSFWLPRMTSIWSIAQCGIWTVGMYIEGKRKLKRSLMVDFAHVLFHRIEYVRSFKQIFTAKKPQHSLYWLDLKKKIGRRSLRLWAEYALHSWQGIFLHDSGIYPST